ncbi:hypothetical protein [Streptomyces sp. NPDC050121]|uniref:hypothetical protein n=1 Tax=Streptomyces sp. NPDC050121 TaxID=3365601 RepID=UPI0037B87946
MELLETPHYTHNFAYAHPNFSFTDVEVGETAYASSGPGAGCHGSRFVISGSAGCS